MPDIKPFPKPDLSFYHDIPEGACLNYNNRYDYYQVYRSIQVEDPVSGEGVRAGLPTDRSGGTALS